MRPLKITILSLSILIFIFFVLILGISIFQYRRYKIVNGLVVCVEFIDRCLLAFNYKDTKGEVATHVSPIAYDEINRSGVFQVSVAHTLNQDGRPDDFFVIGSPFHVFLGTKSMLIIYLVLTFLSLLVCLSFIPGLYQPSKNSGRASQQTK